MNPVGYINYVSWGSMQVYWKKKKKRVTERMKMRKGEERKRGNKDRKQKTERQWKYFYAR